MLSRKNAYKASLLLLCLFLLVCTLTAINSENFWGSSTEELNDIWSMPVATGSGILPLKNFRDKPTILSFYFTACLTACPVQTAKLNSVHKSLPSNIKENINFLSVSINPYVDTIASSHEFAKRFGIDVDHWQFVIPKNPDHLDQLLSEVGLETVPGINDQIDHAMHVYLVMPDGKIVHRYTGHRFREAQLLQDLINITQINNQLAFK